jgi:hypothetical protein
MKKLLEATTAIGGKKQKKQKKQDKKNKKKGEDEEMGDDEGTCFVLSPYPFSPFSDSF